MNWGIAKPSAKATLSATAPDSETIASFASGDSPGYTVGGSPATIAYVTGADGTATGATQLTPGVASGITFGQLYRTFASDQDFLNVDGTDGSDQDVFDITIKMSDPSHVKYIGLAFDLDATPSTTKFTDRYTFVFYPKQGVTVDVRDPAAESENVYQANVTSSLDPVEPMDRPRESTPAEVKAIIGEGKASVSGTPAAPGVPPASQWVHFACTRGQFTRTGTTTGRDWSTVTQVAI
jgi:hypothetical protein